MHRHIIYAVAVNKQKSELLVKINIYNIYAVCDIFKVVIIYSDCFIILYTYHT